MFSFSHRLAESAALIEIAGHAVPSVNAPRCFVDRLGHRLSEGKPFAVVWAEAHGRLHFSLRSRDGGEVVNQIAEQYGGRGHPHAAVFSLPAGSPDAARLLGHLQQTAA